MRLDDEGGLVSPQENVYVKVVLGEIEGQNDFLELLKQPVE